MRSKLVVVSAECIFIVISGVFILGTGCEGPKTILIGESKSPDGTVIARVYKSQLSGIGTGDASTVVNLNWTKGSQAPMTVLAFDDGLDQPEGDKNVGIKWIAPTKLELSYRAPRHIGFQATKWHGIDISLRELSAGASAPRDH